MNVLGLDIGSSSVKAGIVRQGKIVGSLVRASFPTHFDGARAEVPTDGVLKAIASAVADLGSRAKKVDAVNFSVMSPAWVAMDRKGKALTPLVTHQDRRSVEIARDLAQRVGEKRWLGIAGNLPFPGGISATTAAWFAKNQPGILRRADLIGHLNTYLHRQITEACVIDHSNASFTGLYETVKQGGWSEELCHAVGVESSRLPRILESNVVPGVVKLAAARKLGITQGMPVMTGMIDTSSAMVLAGATVGQLFNVSGSTDVLGLCVDEPRPHPRLLTRALGIGRKWMSVGTLAAAGSAITWMKAQFFSEMSTNAYYKLVSTLAHSSRRHAAMSGVEFDPYLAGERTSIEQKKAAFRGLTLATTREDLLIAVIDALAKASGARLALLQTNRARMLRRVITSGGAARSMHEVLHRDWPGRWTFASEEEASLRGLSAVDPVQA